MKNSRFFHNSRIPFALGSAIAAMLATQAAHAATGTWNVDANGLWSNAGNWTPSFADGSGFAANFTNDITADRTVSLDSARTLGTLVFSDSNTSTAGSWILDNNGNAANTLTGLSTITVNALGAGKTATISAAIVGSEVTINTSGSGTLVLAGANTFTKNTNNAGFAMRLTGGTVVIASDSAFGVTTGTGFNATTLINLNGTTLQASGSERTVANPIWLNAASNTVSGNQSITFSGAVMGRSTNPTLTNNITGGGTLSLTNNVYTNASTTFHTLTFGGSGNTLISGVIANNTANVAGQNGSIIKSGAGTLTLSNTASTYTGATQILASVMEVAALANGGTASSIGQSTNAASNLVFGAPTATLRYTGSSNVTTNRGFTLSSGTGGGATIESSGSGTLTIDNTVALAYGNSNQTRLLTLGGTNTGANTFSKVIADNGSGATAVTKAGAGRWNITGTNTYTGATNVTTGTLAITGSGSINDSSGVTVAAGANFVYNSSTPMTNSLSLSGAGTSSRTILGGTGTINTTLTLDNLGDTLSPGNSPGIQTFTPAQTWSSFSYDWEVNNFTGTTAGTDFDQLGLSSTLNLSGGSGSYILNILSLTALNAAGNVPNFSEVNRSWTILTSSGITGFNAANWSINTTNFTNSYTGAWVIAQSGNDLVLSYNAIPEPNITMLLGSMGLFALVRRRR